MADNQVLRLIGIDFGTSTSVVRVKRYQDGKPIGDSFTSSSVTFGNGESDTKAVTLVRRNADGSFTCGENAQEQAPDSIIYREFKMDLESPDEEKQTQARELTEGYFRYLHQWYEHQHSDLGENSDREVTLVSFPAKWREETRLFMVRAAECAGFQNVTAMDEPSAALYATLCRKMDDINRMGLLRLGEPGYLLLADMGAGTTDLAVCRYIVDNTEGVIRAKQIKNEIIATWPEDTSAPTFGGREVDRMLEEFLMGYVQDCGADPNIARQLVAGSSAVKPWKETSVSRGLNEGARVEGCAFLNQFMVFLPGKKPFPAFGRREFENMLGERLEQFKGLVASCLQHVTQLEPEILIKGIDLVVLTGGHSSWYFTEELLNGTMPGLELPQLKRVQKEKARVMRLSNPQETVALGLVYSQLPLKVRDHKKEAEEEARKAREEAAEEAKREAAEKAGKEVEQQAKEEAGWKVREEIKPFFETNYRNIVEYYQKNADKLIIYAFGGIIAVKSDGSIVCGDVLSNDTTDTTSFTNWRDIVSISRGAIVFPVGLKKDGTVVTTEDNKDGRCNIEGWRDIVSISCGRNHTAGIKEDGIVVAAGGNEEGQCNVESWRDIVSISCGDRHTVGLKKDGTVIATGNNTLGQCNVAGWRDVIAIVCHANATMGIRRDGSVICNNYISAPGLPEWLKKKHFRSKPPKIFPFNLF